MKAKLISKSKKCNSLSANSASKLENWSRFLSFLTTRATKINPMHISNNRKMNMKILSTLFCTFSPDEWSSHRGWHSSMNLRLPNSYFFINMGTESFKADAIINWNPLHVSSFCPYNTYFSTSLSGIMITKRCTPL